MATTAPNTSSAVGGSGPPASVASLCWESVGELLLSLSGHWGDEDPSNSPHPWLCSVVASAIIGLAGIVPMLIIPTDYSSSSDKTGSGALQLLLSFAVGGLLADVFLHLLPEAWTSALAAGLDPHEAFTRVGLCVLFGIFVFIVVEMLASGGEASLPDPPSTSNTLQDEAGSSGDKRTQSSSPSPQKRPHCNGITSHHHHNNNNNNTIVYEEVASKTAAAERSGHCGAEAANQPQRKIEVIGYLNLLANGIDNFAHGLAVAGSFMVSYRTGVLTTSAILVHEVPHEIGDFAILLSSGFTRWEAAKAQLYTASVGLLGALFTLTLGSSSVVGGVELYILGFTAGAFLNISLVSVLPQLLKEERPAHSAAQMLALLLGTYTMAALAC